MVFEVVGDTLTGHEEVALAELIDQGAPHLALGIAGQPRASGSKMVMAGMYHRRDGRVAATAQCGTWRERAAERRNHAGHTHFFERSNKPL